MVGLTQKITVIDYLRVKTLTLIESPEKGLKSQWTMTSQIQKKVTKTGVAGYYKNCNQTSTRPLPHQHQKSTVTWYPNLGLKTRRQLI